MSSIRGVFATVIGALTGILSEKHFGTPAWLFLMAIGGSLVFGLVSSSFRPEDAAERVKLIKQNAINSGALWVLSSSIVWAMNLHFSTAMVVALVIGLFGTHVLEALDKNDAPGVLAKVILKWWSSLGPR